MVNKKLVLMRKGDFFINATQTIALADKEPVERQKILCLLKEKTEVKVYSPGAPLPFRYSWINFYFGQALCKHLGLEQKMQPLLDYGQKWKPGYDCDAQQLIYEYLIEVEQHAKVSIEPNLLPLEPFEIHHNYASFAPRLYPKFGFQD